MEKYREWEDTATGVAPFVPEKSKNIKLSPITRILLFLSYIIAPFLAIIRLHFFTGAIVWLAFWKMICFLLPISFLRRPLEIFNQRLGGYLVLFILGFLWIPTEKKKSASYFVLYPLETLQISARLSATEHAFWRLDRQQPLLVCRSLLPCLTVCSRSSRLKMAHYGLWLIFLKVCPHVCDALLH